MNMKLPLSIIVIISMLCAVFAAIAVMSVDKKQDSKLEDLGSVQFHGTEMNAWKTGDCYVFGVKAKDNKNPPQFFSNCQR